MRTPKFDSMIIKAQEEKLRGYREDLQRAQTPDAVQMAFRRINRTSQFIRHIKSNGFMSWKKEA